MTAARWDRLAADLQSAGIQATVTANNYSEAVYGRVSHGVSRSIVILRPGAGTVGVHDAWWRKNSEVWIGYEVHAENREGIVTRTWPRTKKRSEAVAAVLEALEPVTR